MIESKAILVVDDEQGTKQGITKTLEVWSNGKYEILSADDGPEAYKIFNKKRIHLLITDVCMPEMDGLTLLKRIKNQGHKPVVIIISGYPEFEYAQEAIHLGVMNYLLKPVSKQKLIEAVEQAMKTERSMERAAFMEKIADSRLLQIDEENHHPDSPIKIAITYINDHIKNHISLKEVAEYVHLNASYFSVLFKEQTNLTFSEYITRKRLQISKNLLLTTDLQIEEIAQKSGYQSAKYFIKLFKEYERTTPSKYRKTSRFDDLST